MKKNSSFQSLFFFLLFLLSWPFIGYGQEKISRTIEWQGTFENKFPDESVLRSLHFKGATLNKDLIPVYRESFPMPGGTSGVRAELINVQTEALNDISLIPDAAPITTEFTIISELAFRKKSAIAGIEIVPIRRSVSGSYEKLISFDLRLIPESGNLQRQASRTYTSSSVLASGNWYRIGVTQNGVYKLSYQQLKSLGMDVDNLDPRHIRIYGNGGGQLPYANYKFRYDDLQENSIIVSGENDGVLNESDYVLFYGTGQHTWTLDPSNNRFNHQINLFADTTYYFICADLGTGKRIQTRASSGATPNTTVTSFNDYQFHEAELINMLKSGREWYGESFDNLNNTRSFSFSFPNLSTTDTVYLKANLIGRSSTKNQPFVNSFSMSVNGQSMGTQPFSNVGVNAQDNKAVNVYYDNAFLSNSSTLNVNISFTSTNPSAQGWLNYLEFNVKRALDLSGSGSQFEFRNVASSGPGNISEFVVSNASASTIVWDVTDRMNPVLQQGNLNGSSLRFTVATDQVRNFIAYGNTLYTPFLAGAIDNQNLHGMPNAHMLIVSNPAFMTQSEELAQFHRNHRGLSVNVASTRQIFNEFSSGAQDVSAIRNFVKMFYDRALSAADLPRYLLIMGDASYDNKYRISANTNFVTSYQSLGSLNDVQSYMSDDFFALLDDSEGEWANGEIVDMSVGRLPVKSVTEAAAAVKKIIHYGGGDILTPINPLSSQSSSIYGDWRNNITFVSDDQDGNTHFKQAETLATRMGSWHPTLNVDKIHIDSYNQVSTPGGNRYPDARTAINERIQRGTLLMTYIGHGGELGWAHERILEVDDIIKWSNYNQMAAFLTATCEFTRVDDPGRTSAGELVFLNPNGGGICLYTTSRLAFSSSNFNLSQKFITHFMNKVDGHMPTIGEVFEQTKIDVFSDQYVRNFILIGDPALRLSYPQMKVNTKTVNGIDINTTAVDTLKALSKVTITGEVQTENGSKMSSFNGVIYPTVYDKVVQYFTLGNDQSDTEDPSYPEAFNLQKNVIYKGKASVTNGDFSFSFVVPKDILFQFGNGKISYYAHNGSIDAAGFDNRIVAGGYNDQAIQDAEGPEVQLYINDEKFVRGGMTDKDPILYAIVTDSSGINTVGTGIGHDMTAELDQNTSKLIVLNDYYENDLNSYQQGRVRYQFKDLAPGPHTVKFKVWDVHNNSSDATTDFVVAESAKLALDHVLNYPNPFTTHTTFMFEHNRPFSQLDVQVQIFTVSGKLIKTIADKIYSEGYRSDDLEWNGLDEYGDKIGKGVYIYKLRVKTPDGSYADKFEKLVILR